MQREIDESIIFTVSEVTMHLKQVIETQIETVYIVGEVSNFVRHSSGHIYLNLKDDNAVMRCAFFRNQNYNLEFNPVDGDRVVCYGKVTVYEKSGQYQLLVQNMFPYGKGILQQRFEQLKAKLRDEGLFDSIHKKPLPLFPETIGIVTSPTGAALQDILNILKRRYPCRVLVYPALMQGDGAPAQNIQGIEYFNRAEEIDLIIIARGGGSQEDLFCFNDEALARAIYASKIPVVSAIGHEIDFTIADYVADLRVPTPSAAAEIVTPDKTELIYKLDSIGRQFDLHIRNKIGTLHRSLQQSQIRILRFNPERIWQSYQQRYDESVSVIMGVNEQLRSIGTEFHHKQKLLGMNFRNAVRHSIDSRQQKLLLLTSQFGNRVNLNLQNIKHKLSLASKTLEDVSPRKILSRGYAFVRKEDSLIQSIDSIKVDDLLTVTFINGKAKTKVISTQKDKQDCHQSS